MNDLMSFENLKTSVKVQHRRLKKMLTKGTDEYIAWTNKARLGLYESLTPGPAINLVDILHPVSNVFAQQLYEDLMKV